MGSYCSLQLHIYSGDCSVLVSAELTLLPDRSIFQSCLQQSTLRRASMLFPCNTKVCNLRQALRRSIATGRKTKFNCTRCFDFRWFRMTTELIFLPMSFPDRSMYLASSREEGVCFLISYINKAVYGREIKLNQHKGSPTHRL